MMLMLIFLLFTLPVTVTAEEHGTRNFSALHPSLLTKPHRGSSFSGEYGYGGGTSFTLSGNHRSGRLNGFRIHEQCGGIIHGIQFQYGQDWSQLYGIKSGLSHEVFLNKGERITQVLGKYYSYYIQQLIFITSHRRIFTFGQPGGYSFNASPHYQGGFLNYISGHHNSYGITGIGFHWSEPRLVKA
ncbi:zymogen granule membrane protein 16-like [Dromiciops gliroides]|uniref:zymogen granule membrane protein 16-like n=1 Tax=Dromiciops gliroides TaxID=33562 RepID=UPI001CC4AC96|nr:zymogen granule membrane protein 16-like [Dromiciops gliroides]